MQTAVIIRRTATDVIYNHPCSLCQEYMLVVVILQCEGPRIGISSIRLSAVAEGLILTALYIC